MTETESQSLIAKIYSEILSLRKEVDEIKAAIIHEDEPEEDEMESYHAGKEEIASGKYRPWGEVKRDLGIE